MIYEPAPKSTSPGFPGITPSTAQPPYFAVSITKLVVMSLCTFSLYELYWFYKNWVLVKDRERSSIMPFWRALFSYFFCYSLFAKIRDTAMNYELKVSLPAKPLAAGWIIATLLWKMPDPYGLVSFFAFLFLLPVQGVVNEINAKVAPGHEQNRRFSAINIAIIILGGLLFVAAIIGTFMPTE
jgi:hypothetical protein